jgi:hypothetical protein
VNRASTRIAGAVVIATAWVVSVPTGSSAQSVYGEFQYYLTVAHQHYATDTVTVDARLFGAKYDGAF